MDQFYFESGYLEAGYVTIVKEATAGFTPYIAEGYFPVDYFDYDASAFSLSANLTKAGEPVFAVGAFVSVATTTAIVNVIRSGAAQVTATFTQSATISHIEGADLFAFSNAQLEAAVRRIRDNNITASAVFSVATDATRTRNISSDDFAEFSFTANTVRSRDFASSQSAAFSLSAAIDNRTRDQSSALTSAVTLTATISHIEGADLTAFSNAAITTTALRIKQIASSVTSSCTLSADVIRYPGIIQNLSSQFTQSANAVSIPRVIVSLSSAFTFFTDYDRLFAGPTALSGGSYDTAIINTSTTKFGAGSLSWTMDADVQPTSDVFWTGTEFVAANTSFKWTSSNGTSWTRSSITGAKIPLNYGNGYYFNGNQYSTDLNTWSTISTTIPGSSGSYISSIGYTGGVYYIFTQYISGSRFRGGYASASTPGGSWTHNELYDGGTTGAGSSVQLLDFNQSNGLIAVVVTGTGGLGLYVNHFNGSTVTNIAGALPTLSINTNNFAYEQFCTVATKASTQYLRSVRDTQNPRRDGIVYTNGASTGSFVFGTSGGSDQEIKYVINDIAYVNNIWLVHTSGGVFKSTATVPTSYSDFTLTSDQSLGKLEFGASKYVSTGFYSSDATTWTVSVPSNTTGYQGYLEYAQGDGSDLGNWSTIDFWAYVPDIVGGTTYSLMIVGQTNQTNYLQWGLSKTSGAAPFIRFNRVKGDVNDDQTNFVSSGDASQGWHHIRISASGSNLAVYYDGVRKIYRTDAYGTFAGKLRLRSSELLIDDFLVSDTLITDPSVASFSVPTTKSSRDANTDLLLRFDTDFSNVGDLAPVIPRANISAVAAVLATAKKTTSAASSLSSQFTQTAEATVFVLFEAAFTSVAATSATVLRIKSSGVALDSAFTQTTNAVTTRSFTSNQASAFTQSSEAVKTTNIVLALNSQATFTAIISHIEGADLVAFTNAAITTEAVVTRSAVSTQSSSVTLVAANSRTRDFNSTQNSEFTFSANAVKNTSAASAVNSAFTSSADANRTRNNNSSLSSAFTQTTIGDVTKVYQSNLSVSVAVTASSVKTANAIITLESIAVNLVAVVKTAGFLIDSTVTTTLTASLDGTLQANSNLAGVFTQTANNSRQRDFLIAAQVSTTQSASVGLIKEASSSQASNFAVTASAIKTGNNSVVLSSAFALSSSAIKLNGGNSALSSQSTLQANNDRIRSFSASQASAFTQSSIVRASLVGSSSLASVSSFTAIISHIEGADLVVNGFATLTAEGLAGKFAQSDQSSSFTQTAAVDRIRGFATNQSSQFTVSTVANELVQLSSNISNQVTISATATKTANATSSQSTVASVSCTISHILGADLVAENFATLTAQATKFRGFALTATTAVNLTVSADKLRAFNSNLAVSTSLNATAIKGHRGQATLQAQATIVANAGKQVLATVTITSAMTFIAEVREIDINSVNQVVYRIPQETWTYRIAEEIWTRTITPETRIYTVKEE